MKKLNTLLVLTGLLLFSQKDGIAQFTVSGTVSDASGVPLIGVNILVTGTTAGTVTDIDGTYSLKVPSDEGTIVFSYTGFREKEVDVTKDMTSLNVTLEEDVSNLSEVVVTGLASSIKRSNLANAVATLSAEEITGVTSQQTLDGALYGKIPGINITQTTGAPGGGFATRLRGVTSLSGNNQPLIILDGVYISNAEIPSGSRFASGANSGTEEGSANRLADINPDDIERVEVLKGASAAAIYGTRANGGVIIITTKKGKSGRTKVSLDQDFGMNRIIRFVGRREYTAAEVEDAFGTAEADLFRAAQSAGRITDYEEEIYGETGFITDTRLSISGGNDKTSFFFGGSVRDEDGIIKNTGYQRNSIRLNLTHKISDDIEFSTYTNYVNSEASRAFTGNENEGGLSFGYNLAFTRDWNWLFPDENGVYPNNPTASGNPIFVRDQTRNLDGVDRFIQGVSGTWRILTTDNSSLRLTATGGIDFLSNETFVYVPETHQAQVGTTNGFVAQGNNRIFNRNLQVLGVFDKYTDNGLSFSTQAGVSWLNFDTDFVLNQTTQLIPTQQNLTQGGAQQTTQTLSEVEEFGFIVQEEINYQDKIIGTIGVRFDKSTLNGDENKYYAFPKASLALNLANFDFWTTDAFDQFKIRAAYGETGNSASFGNLFTPLGVNNIDGNGGLAITGFQGRSDLEPETSSEIEVGLDFTTLQGKLGAEISYYRRNVENLLYRNSTPTSSGFSSEIRNDLDLRNQGLEVALNLVPIDMEQFDWTTTLTYWFNRSEVTRLGVPPFVPPGVAFGLGLGTFFVEEGEPITQLKGRDDEGNPTTIGDIEPDFQLAWFNEFRFLKNFDANFLLHWRQGSDILNLSRLLTDIGGVTPEEYADLEGFVEDGTYVRLRELGIYYNIPAESFSNGILQGIRLGVSGRNLFTITDYSSYDPETSTKGSTGLSQQIEVTPFPTSKQFYFHIKLDF
ncbi:MAG: SusC/RagA family TonB-linked outer membrane protein [Bacteroidota bacterium]